MSGTVIIVDNRPPVAPVTLGAMLFTLVEPHRGHEAEYNRWYERDHFYAGCMVGPWILAGARWVATRRHKGLRFPADSPIARPIDAGSYLATYFVEREHWPEHFAWASEQVRSLYDSGRGFEERTHVHTVLYTFRRAHYRDDDPVPVELALDHRYAGLVALHVDRAEGVTHDRLDEWLDTDGRGMILGPDSPFALVASWRPVIPPETQGPAPMSLGSGPGTSTRSAQLIFCEVDPAMAWEPIRRYGAAIDASGLATVRFAAPFIPTVVGTDTYCDQLW